MMVAPLLPCLECPAQAPFTLAGRRYVHQSAESVTTALNLCGQPLGRHLTVSVRACQPPGAPPQQFSSGCGPGDTDAACIQLYAPDPVSVADGARCIRTSVQRDHYLHCFAAEAWVQGRNPDGLQAPRDTVRLIVGGYQDAYHRKPSFRANDKGPRVHP